MSLHAFRRWGTARVVVLLFSTIVALSAVSRGETLAPSLQERSDRTPAANRRPNILFIMTDQQHAGMMSCAGNRHVKTPAMDSLARGGIRFVNAYTTNPVCVPSRISLATGVMPGRLGVFSNGMKANAPAEVELNSLGNLIKSAGYYRWIYCRLTEQVDKHIGRLLDAVRRNGLEKDTLIVLTSDHGDMDASHRLASKGLFYDESAGVPLLMKFTGTIRPGKVDHEHLVSNGLDILPTLCDYAGVASPKTLLGRSLRPIAEGRYVCRCQPFRDGCQT